MSAQAGGDRLWITVAGDFGEQELRLTVRERQVNGYWAGGFVANGTVSGSVRP